MPAHPRSYSPAAAEKLRRALLALAASAATATAADPARPAPRLAGAPPPPPRADDNALGRTAGKRAIEPAVTNGPPPSNQTFAPDGTHAFLECVEHGDTLEPLVLPPPLVPLAPKEGFSIRVVTVEDTGLLSIAKSQGIDLATLLAANPQLDDPDYICVGQQIYVPDKPTPTREPRVAGAPVPPPRADDPPAGREAGSAPGAPAPGATPAPPPKPGFTVYIVRSGDTLSAIAQRHEVLQKSIVEANGLADPNRIRAGQPLYVPTQKDPSYTQRTGGKLVPTP